MIPGKLLPSGPPLPPGCILEPGLDKLRALPPLALVLCDTGRPCWRSLKQGCCKSVVDCPFLAGPGTCFYQVWAGQQVQR